MIPTAAIIIAKRINISNGILPIQISGAMVGPIVEAKAK